MTRVEYNTEQDKIVKDLIPLFNEYFLPKRNISQKRKILPGKTNGNGNIRRTLAETDRDRERMQLWNYNSQRIISKFMTAITDKKLRDKLMKEKKPEKKKTIDMIEQNTTKKNKIGYRKH